MYLNGCFNSYSTDHPLSEVRGRSLRNILFKVQNNLISVSELVSDKFLRHLLEWFNHPECSHESHVLELIDKLIVQVISINL